MCITTLTGMQKHTFTGGKTVLWNQYYYNCTASRLNVCGTPIYHYICITTEFVEHISLCCGNWYALEIYNLICVWRFVIYYPRANN